MRDGDALVATPPQAQGAGPGTTRLTLLEPRPAPPTPRLPRDRPWKANFVTLPTHSTPAPPGGLTTAVPRREYWFGLPAARTSARAARDTVRHRLRAWQVTSATCYDAVLLVSELTTNAVLHTDSEQVLCGLTLTGGEQRLRIELHDEGRTPIRTPIRPPEHQAGPCQESGRGLFLVQELADRWGSAHSTRAEGKVVWAELATCP